MVKQMKLLFLCMEILLSNVNHCMRITNDISLTEDSNEVPSKQVNIERGFKAESGIERRYNEMPYPVNVAEDPTDENQKEDQSLNKIMTHINDFLMNLEADTQLQDIPLISKKNSNRKLIGKQAQNKENATNEKQDKTAIANSDNSEKLHNHNNDKNQENNENKKRSEKHISNNEYDVQPVSRSKRYTFNDDSGIILLGRSTQDDTNIRENDLYQGQMDIDRHYQDVSNPMAVEVSTRMRKINKRLPPLVSDTVLHNNHFLFDDKKTNQNSGKAFTKEAPQDTKQNTIVDDLTEKYLTGFQKTADDPMFYSLGSVRNPLSGHIDRTVTCIQICRQCKKTLSKRWGVECMAHCRRQQTGTELIACWIMFAVKKRIAP